MKNILTLSVLSSAILTSTNIAAETGKWGLGVTASTVGLGIEGSYGITNTLNVRTSLRSYSFDDNIEEDDIDYTVDLDIKSALTTIDWHPGDVGFRISAGLLLGGFDIKGEATCKQATCEVDDNTYTAAELGTLTLDIDSGAVSPYLGIGYGNATVGSGLGFSLDIGVAFTTGAESNLRSDSALCGSGTSCNDDLQAQAKEIEDELTAYPVIGLGVSYTF